MESNIFTKVPPENREAEESLLGCMIQNQNAVSISVSKLSPEDFYYEENRKIFVLMHEMYSNNVPINNETLLFKLKEKDYIVDVDYVMRLLDAAPVTRNAEYFAEIILKKSTLRKLIKSTGEIQELCYTNSDENIHELLNEVEQKIFLVTQNNTKKDFEKISEIAVNSIKVIEERSRGEYKQNIMTGYIQLDKMTNGFSPTDLIVLAARPSVGKTGLALNIIENVITHPDYKKYGVAFFSMEMSKQQIFERLLSSKSGVKLAKVRKGEMSNQEWVKLGIALDGIADSLLFVDDSNPLTAIEMKAKCRKLKNQILENDRKSDLKLVVVDYLQLMSSNSKKSQNREQEVADISRQLKSLAKEINVPIIALSQLNRGISNRTGVDKKPRLSDLRESGSIEQDADLVMFLHNEITIDDSYEEEDAIRDDIQKKKLIIAKHRNGPIGEFNLLFFENIVRFQNMLEGNYEK